MEACPWCGEPMMHYMTHVCENCTCTVHEERILGEPWLPPHMTLEPDLDCPVHKQPEENQ